MSCRPIIAIVALLLVAASLRADTPEEFFEKRIRPVLAERCYSCHGERAEKLKGGLKLDSADAIKAGGTSGKPLVRAGDPDGSLLIEAIRWADDDLRMPPKEKLPANVVADFEAWVKSGGVFPKAVPTAPGQQHAQHWAFQPVVPPAVPTVEAQTEIDRFIVAKMNDKRLTPSPAADRRTLIRRATYDLHGLAPTAEEVAAFEKDRSPDAWERLIDRLLASPRYGERMARGWLDLARYSDTKGYVYDREERRWVHSHVYRDWVIHAFNNDMPYDRFILNQVAADRIDGGQLAGMGFLTIGRRFLGVPHDIIDDRIDVVTRTTMGLTVACARCHDHKFDPVPTEDYYSLYGVFAGTTERLVRIEDGVNGPERAAYEGELARRVKKAEETFASRKAAVNARLRRQVDKYLLEVPEAEKTKAELFYEIMGENDINPVVLRQWHAYIRSRAGASDPVWGPWHAMAGLSKKEWAEGSSRVWAEAVADPRLDGRVAEALREVRPGSMKDVAAAYGKVLTKWEQAWRESKTTREADPIWQCLHGNDSPARVPEGSFTELEFFFDEGGREAIAKAYAEIDRWHISAAGAAPHALVLNDRPTQQNARVFLRGNPATRGKEAPRRFLEVVAGKDRPTWTNGSGRLELARAIVDPKNPLTARVMVNRIWVHQFGAGLVRTPSDFGVRAEPPSHPELLDYLASRFVESGWSVKAMHRDIMRSAAYRQASADRPECSAVDPENRLLWRMERRRLDLEQMRDSMLQATGELDPRMGGRGEELFKGASSRRRAIYGYVDRQFLPATYRVFDFANPDLHAPQRFETTVPQQALYFLNNAFVMDRARAVSKATANLAPADRVRTMYRRLLQRDPSAEDLSLALSFVASVGNEPAPPPPPKPKPTQWRYGYGQYDAAKDRIVGFTPLPHFNGTAWQGGPSWPDGKLGWVRITADGGHAGNDLKHAAVLRFVAEKDVTVSVSGPLWHASKEGDGVVARVVSGRNGKLAEWVLHDRKVRCDVEPVELKAGDTLDFVVDLRGNLNNDEYKWTPTIKAADGKQAWDAKKEFAGASPPPPPEPLTAWEKYAQVLLMSNEFLFVD